MFFIIIHTGLRLNKNEHVKPVVHDHFDFRSCDNNSYVLSSVKHPAARTDVLGNSNINLLYTAERYRNCKYLSNRMHFRKR